MTKIKKIACVTIPNFPVEVCLRDYPEFQNRALALAASELDDAEIVAINQKAVEAGLLLHITAAQGHILCPDLIIKVRHPEREIEQSNGVYKKLQSFSPFVEETLAGLYFLDASGLEFLYKSDSLFATVVIAAIKAITTPSYPCRVGIGRNKLIAQIAADLSDPDGFTMVSPRQEKKFLHPLALERLQTDELRLSGETLASLHDLGLHTIGQVAAFPANEMIRRFGPRGELLSQLARGADPELLTPDQYSEPLTETVWVDNPVTNHETIINLIKDILPRLLQKLSRYSQGCSVVKIDLHLERSIRAAANRHSSVTVLITLERPTLSLPMFIRQLRTTLESQPRQEGINGLTLTIPNTTALLTEQLSLSGGFQSQVQPTGDLPDSPAITVPVTRNLFLPEQRLVFVSPHTAPPPRRLEPLPTWSTPCSYAGTAIGALRLCRPARPIEVTLAGPRPVAIKQTRITGRGPWELSGLWWSHDYDRHYWEVTTETVQRFLIYHDRLTDRWFLQGIFD